MRVALAVDNDMVTEHFGHCEYFIVYDVVDNQKQGSNVIKNPPHQKGYLPKFLNENKIDVVIAGNMGAMAQKMLEELGIEYLCGVTGNVVDVIDKYISGELEVVDTTCHEHRHHGHHE